MAKRGPKPTPSKVLKLRGSWLLNNRKDEPQPESGAPSCPSWVGTIGKREWKRITKQLEPLGLLTELDRVALALYCQAYDDYVTAKKEMDKEDMRPVVKTANYNYVQNPMVGVMNKAWQRVLKAAAEFGLTPSARTRISVPEGATKRKDGKTRFFRTG